MIWPSDITVPAAPQRGRQRDAETGFGEGALCARVMNGQWCVGRIEYLPDLGLDGCGCAHSPMPPCSYCTSTEPECPRCGWRYGDPE